MSEPILISIVIPAYNEAKRLPLFLDSVIDYCARSDRAYEIIVVDDGSSDRTATIAESFRDRFEALTVLRNARNYGKGYSVKRGLLEARGDIRAFLDADGSTQPEEIERNLHHFKQGADIVIGSRAKPKDGQILKVRLHRKLIGHIFNFLIRSFLFDRIKDTQCGFKMFKAEAIKPLMSRIYLCGFGFDIELLYLAHKMGYTIIEEPVSWHHVSASKVNLLTDSLSMLANIFQVRIWHCTPISPNSQWMGPDEYRFMHELEEHHWWFTARRDMIAGLMRGLSLNQPDIIDLGCGTGANLAMLSSLGKAVGVDGSKQAVDYCRKRGLVGVQCGPIERVDQPDQSFDIVTCLDVLEHTDNPVDALKEMSRILKQGGKIIITVPAFRFLWSRHDEALCHRRRYDRASLMRDLELAGLKADKISYFYFLSFFAVAPIRLARRLWASKSKAKSDTTTLPPAFLNSMLKMALRLEASITIRWGLPFGTTLYAIVSKNS